MLNNSPLYQTLQEIHGVLNEEKKSGSISAPNASGFLGPGKLSGPYHFNLFFSEG